MAIHPTAVVAPGAEVHPSCEVGPYAVIGPQVRLGPDCRIGAHAVIEGDTVLGAGNRVFPHAVLGQIPQDLKYGGEPTKLVVGDRNQFREFTTAHVGTAGGGGVTRIGSGCLFMANAHVAHDCQVGDGCILANSVALAGHVVLEDHVILGGLSGVHQFVRLGRYAFLAAGSVVVMDVPPYCTVQGDRARLAGLNTVGLQRAGFTEAQGGRIRAAYRKLFRSKLKLEEALGELRAEMGAEPEIAHLVAFLEGSRRGVTR
ncbi:acyl-ACP--UDP-N-acetylglucosamine O-acyltransferase [Anaeromyxobacter paludicola]|uniref:Acyl-[acyl-carrier-protein]--UDP-N-acetylglucosamine O-acyltransferase n=1 Tax=Anaeromyxobacter paludicola TaxID=2918171 RepID=A0ABN6N5A7_9BACT|nr:acyl-ACP--UDP-N-acetylglucosamine O-acyltransferase [Anaeromyxobacter paludicola]BDG08336.1 acyl-[acyl-carrier-protein]--UDP-N-acetylglucosamine O-acyltransferase [Anaeromyxobacter paludicola]